MIPFIDLAAQQARLKPRIDAAIQRVLAHGLYVMGPEVRAFEEQLAEFGQVSHALSCGNGTDALALPLMAWGSGQPGRRRLLPLVHLRGDAGDAIPWSRATPVFVDILPDAATLIRRTWKYGHRGGEGQGRAPAYLAVIAVDLFDQPADYPRASRSAAATTRS